MMDSKEVSRFWLEECSPSDWYNSTPELDAEITRRFGPLWEAAATGGVSDWTCTPRGCLSYLILTDQFPRNMFRNTGKAFATDAKALSVAKQAVQRGMDLRIEGSARQFFYLPLEHSETTPDQHRAVRLIKERMDAPETLLHACAHREVIRRFGRFPYRNDALGRTSTEAERAMIEAGGYGAVFREVQAAAA